MGDTARPTRLLIVDDYCPNLLALEATLHELGMKVVTTSSAAQAVLYARREGYAAILMDVRMPKVDGIKAAEQIRLTAQNHDTPILFLTAYDLTADEIARARRHQPMDMLHRPCDPTLIRTRLNELLRAPRQMTAE